MANRLETKLTGKEMSFQDGEGRDVELRKE
jgi:hypothetical protein